MLATALWSQSALRFVLLGAATGSLTALVALGIVLVYRTSGVLNFSAGALGGIAAYVCYNMRDGGTPTALAVALGLLVGVGLGLLTYAVMALLRDASRLARLIATAYLSRRVIGERGRLLQAGLAGKAAFASVLVTAGILIWTGGDKALEAWLVARLPAWWVDLLAIV